jgi:hypothetical protein
VKKGEGDESAAGIKSDETENESYENECVPEASQEKGGEQKMTEQKRIDVIGGK